MAKGLTMPEVLEYGPVVFADEDFGCLISIGHGYLHWWRHTGEGRYEEVDVRSSDKTSFDLNKITVSKAMDLAKEWFDEASKSEEE